MKNFKEIVITVLILIGLFAVISVLSGVFFGIGYRVFLWVM